MVRTLEDLAWAIIKTIDYDLYKEMQLWDGDDDDETLIGDIIDLIQRYIDERA